MRPAMGFFVAPDDLPRARRPSDVVSVAFGLLLLLWGVLASDVQTAWEQAFTETITSLPAWATGALSVVFAFGLFYGLGIIVVAFLARRTEGGTLRDLLLAVLLVAALSFLLSWWVTGTWPYVLPDIGLADPEPRFPVVRVAGIAAVMLAASPHLSRPIRRVGWVVIALSAVAAVALGYGTPSDVAGGLGIGFISAGAILLVFGSPRGFPDVDAVSSSLEAMDVAVGDVTIDPDQSWGVRRLRAVSVAGVPIEIKAYGRDAHESQWFAKLWRATWYREDGRTVSYTRLQAVEHEALVTLMATRTGASVADVIAAGSETREVALLATESPGRILAAEQPEEISDDLLRALWSDVQRLHEASIAHGSLTAHAVRVDRTHHWITDFELGVLGSADSDRLVDVVELLFSLAVLVGVDRAVATALDALGRDRIVEALPYVQLPAISASSRRTVKKPKEVVHELQNALAESADTELPEPVKLTRVTPRTLLMFALLLLAAWALIPLFAGIDYAEVWSELQGADWILMVIALLIGQTMFIPQATGMMFAVPAQLPLWPLVILQISVKFIGLAVPSAAGRVAMNAAFLRKYGMSITVAITQGAIDGFADFFVQAIILLVALLSGSVDLGVTVDTGDVNWGLVIVIVVLLIAAVVVAVVRIRRLRDRVVPVLREGWGALRVVLKDPGRTVGLLGSNLAYNLIQAVVLWIILVSLDSPLGFGEAIVAVVATTLLQGIVPIPGGVGVTEAVMTGFLVAMGIDEAVAFAATIVYRAITFYLPAMEGFFAMRWLENNDYL